MDRLKRKAAENLKKHMSDLHSNMDRLKPAAQLSATHWMRYLHSNIDRLKQVLTVGDIIDDTIYIPIWID